MKPRYLYPSDYYADPSANVFNGKLFVYPSHDWEAGAAFDDDGGHFQMKDYHVISMEDVENGEVTDYGKILDVEQVAWAEKQMWDNDVVEKDGKYFLIFSAKDYNGVFHLGVAVADKPEGPFIPQEQPMRGSYSIDPCVFKDDDGQIYCYFGGLWGGQLQWYKSPKQLLKEGIDLGPAADKKTQLFAPADVPALPSSVVRLSDDVMQFAEAPRDVIVIDKDGQPLKAGDPHRFFEASWMHKYNGKYYFSYSTGDSHFLCYAIGDNPYGPFTYQGVLLDPVVGWTTHHSIVQYKGEWFLFYHDCVPSNDITHLRSLKVHQEGYQRINFIQLLHCSPRRAAGYASDCRGAFLLDNQGGKVIGREEFPSHLLYILCRNGVDLSEELIEIALIAVVKEVPAEVEGKLLTVVTGDGNLSFQLSFGSHQLRGRERTKHHTIQFLSYKSQATVDVVMVTTEIDTPNACIRIGRHRTLHRIDQSVPLSQREVQTGIHPRATYYII